MWQCRRLIGRAWDFTLRIMPLIFTAVVRPAEICHLHRVGEVYGKSVNAKRMLSKVQKTAHTSAFEVLSGLTPTNRNVYWTGCRLHKAAKNGDLELWNDTNGSHGNFRKDDSTYFRAWCAPTIIWTVLQWFKTNKHIRQHKFQKYSLTIWSSVYFFRISKLHINNHARLLDIWFEPMPVVVRSVLTTHASPLHHDTRYDCKVAKKKGHKSHNVKIAWSKPKLLKAFSHFL